MILLANEKDVDAIPCLQQAAILAPDDFRWHYYLGLAAASLNRELATSSYARASEIRPRDSMAHARLGELLLARGDVARAARHLQQAIEYSVSPDPRPFQALARVRLLEGRIDEARELADEAYRLAPNSRMVLEILARILDRQGEKEHAQRLLHQIQRLSDQPLLWMDPYAEQALALRIDVSRIEDTARALVENGNTEEAIQLLSTELQRSSGSIPIRLTLSQILLQIQRFDEALGVLTDAQTASPQNAEVRFRIGVVRYLQNEFPQAADAFRQTLQLKPDHALALYNLAQCCLQLDDQAGAIDAFEATLQISPDQNLARLNLAKILIQLHHLEQAREHVQRVLDNSPENMEAKELLKQIETK
ncbi:MAG: tetratricopeptide repeat protein [Planctomycetota bacterium]|nr:tetratricopeptide repeat protein [Planctomycetota bacterium]